MHKLILHLYVSDPDHFGADTDSYVCRSADPDPVLICVFFLDEKMP